MNKLKGKKRNNKIIYKHFDRLKKLTIQHLNRGMAKRNKYLVLIARAITTLVGIIFLSVNSMVINDKLISIVHESTFTTAVVGSVTVYQLLFRKANKGPCDNLIYTFNSSCSRERPTSTYIIYIKDYHYIYVP